MGTTQCEECLYGEYDDEYGELVCAVSLDMDELARVSSGEGCPFFRPGDEYTIVRKQN
ncbi:MAG: hypothetical protein IK104_06925 [Clostridia bacterium]|nr:hypothetical protein [Clostridia bacterium]MBR5410388.1 hypothetical protein [Clostridia bacterium]